MPRSRRDGKVGSLVRTIARLQAIRPISGRLAAIIAAVLTLLVPPLGNGTMSSARTGPSVTQELIVQPNVEALAWSQDGTRIATSGQLDRILQVWDWRRGERLARWEKDGLGGRSIGLVGPAVVTSPPTLDPAVALTLWDFVSGGTRDIALPRPATRRRADTFALNAARTRLALLRTFARLVVFDVGTWEPLADIGGLGALRVAVSPEGDAVATANADGAIAVYDVPGGALRGSARVWADHADAIAWAPNGRFIASAQGGARPRRDLSTGKIVTPSHGASIRISLAEDDSLVRESTVDIGAAPIYSLTFSPDSKWLISAQRDGHIRVWDAISADLVGSIRTGGRADFVTFSPDGQFLAAALDDRIVILDWRSQLAEWGR